MVNMLRSLAASALLAMLPLAPMAATAATPDVDTGPTSVASPAAAIYECKAHATKALWVGTAEVPSITTGGSTNCWLAKDTSYSNPATYQLQYHMNHAEGRPVAIDGYFGQNTEDNLKVIQGRYDKLTVDGVYGPATGGYMLWFNGNAAYHWKS